MMFLVLLISTSLTAFTQKKSKSSKKEVPVIIKSGVLYWAEDGKEVALFGVNYTAPFAYSYRAIQKTGISHEEAIQQDVYHFARLGLDAFRVHVWDTEISDTAGNLIENEHLRLFDFLLAELKKYNIKSIITPIAFWGNGYPEQDTETPGFSRKFGKGMATVNDTAIKAQENYLLQFFKHINPYTGLRYQQDKDIIATEINNEPNHSGSQQDVTNYINRLYDAIRNSGWAKPIFYNISENPRYARGTSASKADGYSFQWYPSGLVGGRTLQSNFLPHVDTYNIPFGDSLTTFTNKPLMVYEFDPADIMNPIMYPAMAKSFRLAGFQWATQFAYDPMAIAHANTEYQTHFLNLAYTPAKAISLLIAGEVFRNTKRLAKTDGYPSDSSFGPFRISFRQGLSEMNTDEKFYYTNTTQTLPLNVDALKHIAGTGSSTVVKYEGTGAYFLDQMAAGIWRLEVMPDAILISDPYEKAAPSKTVSAIQWKKHYMDINLPSLGNNFVVKGLNKGNESIEFEGGGRFVITPGAYLLTAKGKNYIENAGTEKFPLRLFFAPKNTQDEIQVNHIPLPNLITGMPALIRATIWGNNIEKVSLLVTKPGWGRPMAIPMQQTETYHFSAPIPKEVLTEGLVQYRILVQSGHTYQTFPGRVNGIPFAWDYLSGPTWETIVINDKTDFPLFNAKSDRSQIVFPNWGPGIQQGIFPVQTAGDFGLRYQSNQWANDGVAGFQIAVANKLQTLGGKASVYQNMVIKCKATNNDTIYGKLIVVTKDAIAYSTPIALFGHKNELVLPLSGFRPDSYLLLPRPYPGFLPLWFTGTYGTLNAPLLKTEEIDLVQFVVTKEENAALKENGPGFEIEWISLRK